jgi:hypothetical protein
LEQDQTRRAGIFEKKNALDHSAGSARDLEDLRIPTQVKLAFLWATVMFMYIYVDIIGFYKPGLIADILVGKVWVFEINDTWLLLSVLLMTVPTLMVILSLVLPAKMNRYANIGLGSFHILLALGTAMGEINAFYMFGSAVEMVLLFMIVWIAWKWPRALPIAAAGN